MEVAAPEVAAVVGKVAERLLDTDDDVDDLRNDINEDHVAAVMRWLELEIKLTAASAASSVLTLPSLPAAAGYATMRGDDESCGPAALSGPASTVMASVDGRAGAPAPPPVPWPWPGPRKEERDEQEDCDDAWALLLLTDGPGAEMLTGSPEVCVGLDDSRV